MLTYEKGCKQIKVLDVGGGVPNNYHGEEDSINFEQYKKDIVGWFHYLTLNYFGFLRQ
jgi:diaminopimelate decarboxylase